MRRRKIFSIARKSIVAAGLLAALVLAACDRSPSVRYRVTIDVEADGRTYTGSSVWEFGLAKGFPQAYAPRFRGESIAVDLPGRGTLFGLMVGRGKDGVPQTGAMEMLPENVYRRTGDTVAVEKDANGDRIKTIRFLRTLDGKQVELDCSSTLPVECPLLVRFRDIRDPTTVEAVDPNDLTKSFGSGVKLKRMTIEITDDDVTNGVGERLKWLRSFHDGGTLRGTAPRDYIKPERNLNYTAFIRGSM